MGKIKKNGNSSKSRTSKNGKRKKDDDWVVKEKRAISSEVHRLSEKFNIKKKQKTLDEEIAEMYQASCSSSYNGSIINDKINKTYQYKFQSDVIPMLWVCCLCGKGYAYEDLGDLFGPYYISSPRRNPDYLCTKDAKKKSRQPNCELWFHGDCLLWAPGIYVDKTRLINLEENYKLKVENFTCERVEATEPGSPQL